MFLLPAQIKTREEINDLKYQWKLDPIWDIYSTNDFENYRGELSLWQYEYEMALKQQYELKVRAKAAQLGCSVALVEYIERLEHRITELEEDREQRDYREVRDYTVKLWANAR
jgi:hypothetical protein